MGRRLIEESSHRSLVLGNASKNARGLCEAGQRQNPSKSIRKASQLDAVNAGQSHAKAQQNQPLKRRWRSRSNSRPSTRQRVPERNPIDIVRKPLSTPTWHRNAPRPLQPRPATMTPTDGLRRYGDGKAFDCGPFGFGRTSILLVVGEATAGAGWGGPLRDQAASGPPSFYKLSFWGKFLIQWMCFIRVAGYE